MGHSVGPGRAGRRVAQSGRGGLMARDAVRPCPMCGSLPEVWSAETQWVAGEGVLDVALGFRSGCRSAPEPMKRHMWAGPLICQVGLGVLVSHLE